MAGKPGSRIGLMTTSRRYLLLFPGEMWYDAGEEF